LLLDFFEPTVISTDISVAGSAKSSLILIESKKPLTFLSLFLAYFLIEGACRSLVDSYLDIDFFWTPSFSLFLVKVESVL